MTRTGRAPIDYEAINRANAEGEERRRQEELLVKEIVPFPVAVKYILISVGCCCILSLVTYIMWRLKKEKEENRGIT